MNELHENTGHEGERDFKRLNLRAGAWWGIIAQNINVHSEKFSNINDTFKRVIGILVN